ncbi:MAG: hypothetical protein NT066_05860 [Candidatus Omnitrophica bacterium]|nr:hypothetical protein [Candidatus Omnitrophota bacterium]
MFIRRNVQSEKGLDIRIKIKYTLLEIINVQSGGEMGVVYKLKPEIKEFILDKKQADPILSCRGLAGLVEDNFKIKLSKSTINAIIKAAKLSMPVGRRRKKRRRPKQEVPLQITTPQETKMVAVPINIPEQVEQVLEVQREAGELNLGLIWLKAADYLLGGANYLVEEIKKHSRQEIPDIFAKTESLIYMPLFGATKEDLLKQEECSGLLFDKKLASEEILSYLNDLQHVQTLPPNLSQIISDIFLDISGIKVTLSSNSTFYLDSQLYTVWSTPHIPSDFSSTIYNIKGYINRYFQGYDPLVLLMAPGYDMPTKEFFDFMSCLEGTEKNITSLALYGDKLKELEVIALGHNRRRYFVFGLWPWQFTEFRQVKKIGEFRPFRFEALNMGLYLADAELELLQPDVNKRVTLRGCALKGKLDEKVRLLVLSNLSMEKATAEQLLNLYLSHWPSLEEAFRDYSRKIELFTYTADSRHFLSTQGLPFQKPDAADIKAVFEYYLKLLDCYVRWHFLPAGYENKDFSTVNEQFYCLKARLDKQKGLVLVTPQAPSGYPFLKELGYACRRINEREIVFTGAKRLFLNVAA